MQTLRRAALRAAASAPRAVAPRASALPIASRSGSNTSATRITALSVGRYFSQTAWAANTPESTAEDGAAPATEEAKADPGTNLNENRPNGALHGVFVRNMVFDVGEPEMKELFGQFGNVNAVHLVHDTRGLSRGFGFVWFQTADEANRAVEGIDGTFWHGRLLNCARRTSERQPTARENENRKEPHPPSCHLYVGNIPYDTSDADLNRLFKGLSNVKNIRVAVDRVTGWPRGFAHADFTDIESATAAKKVLEGVEIGGRNLYIDFAVDRKAYGDAKKSSPRGKQ